MLQVGSTRGCPREMLGEPDRFRGALPGARGRPKEIQVVVLDQIQALLMILQQVAAVVLVEQEVQLLMDQPVEQEVRTLTVL